ncbi:MAG TPA: DUF4327 family protein [Xenococcaceae cyanobacterium]|jgi:hypothetical protein
MTISTTVPRSACRLSIDILRNEAKQLVEKGIISRSQPIYVLCEFLPAREWLGVECELERCDYLLRDRIGDLISCESWDSD